MEFAYLQIKAALEYPHADGALIESFFGEPDYNHSIGDKVFTPDGALTAAREAADRLGGKVFWTLYGIDAKGEATAIGDFITFNAALDVLNAILAPMAAARDMMRSVYDDGPEEFGAADHLDDFINQSTNSERL